MTNATPGPWNVHNVETGAEIGAIYVVARGGNQIAKLTSTLLDRDANALLIASAPRMLAACQARLAEWHADTRNMERAEPESVKLARAAIASATGVK